MTRKDQRGYIDFRNLIVDFSEGDVEVENNVRDISFLNPQKSMAYLVVSCSEGRLSLSTGREHLEIGPGDILICPPKAGVIEAISSDDFECRLFQLSSQLVQALLHDKTNLWQHPISMDQLGIINASNLDKEEFGFYFSLIGSKMRNIGGQAPHEILLALIRAFLLEVCFALENAQGINQEQKLSQGKVLFNRFMNIIANSEVKRQPISDYADQLAITPKYLTMLCQKYSDKTASEWVVQYTIEEIRYYLKSSNLSIKEISARTGFSNMSHFGSYVRKHLGMSPTEYRYNKH